MYQPKTIDTSGLELPQGMEDVVERISANTHDLWSMQRIRDGWTLGPRRDDARKEHPNLVPYEELPESERVYDRRLARETILAVMALGYRIVPCADRASDMCRQRETAQ